MKKYKAVFFDWDGTAVRSRKASPKEAVEAMKPLLASGIKLIIVSGTTYNNIAGGTIESFFSSEELENLYLGLGRGAFNYRFEDGKPIIFENRIPDAEKMDQIHRLCFGIHMYLRKEFHMDTDIVFSRPNYCKIDLSVEADRGESLFMQEDELDRLKVLLKKKGIKEGIHGLFDITNQIAEKSNLEVSATCDAKYLEIGSTTKSDNVKIIFHELTDKYGIKADECAFWGDEFISLEGDIYGSDSFMITEETADGDFYDVSEIDGQRPDCVRVMGGKVERFLEFLRKQVCI